MNSEFTGFAHKNLFTNYRFLNFLVFFHNFTINYKIYIKRRIKNESKYK